MGEPIVSPWIFYWVDALETIKGVSGGFLFFSVIAFVICFISWCNDDNSDDKKDFYSKAFKRIVGSIVVSLLLLTFIPTQETMYRMLIASYVTPESLNTIGNVTKETIQGAFDHSVDRLIDVIKTAKE